MSGLILVPENCMSTEDTGEIVGPKGDGGTSAALGGGGRFHLFWKAGWLSGVPGIGELAEKPAKFPGGGGPGGGTGGGGSHPGVGGGPQDGVVPQP